MSSPLPIAFSSADPYLLAALVGLSERAHAVADNVANADTPGFKASRVPFESRLSAAMARSEQPNQASLDASMRERVEQTTTGRADGNNVDIDREMVELASTSTTYSAVTQLMVARLGLLRSAIVDGRR